MTTTPDGIRKPQGPGDDGRIQFHPAPFPNMLTLNTKFHEGHTDDWRNEVAAELNLLIAAAHRLGTQERAALLSIVSRVADFEEIETDAALKEQQPPNRRRVTSKLKP